VSTSGSTPREKRERRTAWGTPTQKESRWQARIAVIVAALLYLTLPGKYTLGPEWVFPALEGVLLIILTFWSGRMADKPARIAALALIAIVSIANLASLVLLVRALAHGLHIPGRELLYSAIAIWLTNVIVFALWFWELDRGGPEARRLADHPEPDFLFPQMITPGCSQPGWTPVFLDYLYVSFTNATAFSPTDTLPLTQWAKMLMLVESLVSLTSITLVAARAVNVLG
jgi:uncharacterized membrane protein